MPFPLVPVLLTGAVVAATAYLGPKAAQAQKPIGPANPNLPPTPRPPNLPAPSHVQPPAPAPAPGTTPEPVDPSTVGPGVVIDPATGQPQQLAAGYGYHPRFPSYHRDPRWLGPHHDPRLVQSYHGRRW
jgi:hypothetical protein